jgi:ABC-type branched-subunit amino acid transport system ATPase component
MEPESNQPAAPDPRAASTVPSGDTPCIVVTGLRKRFPDGEVLRGIDLLIRRGELVGFTGRSGSGKSTLLHILGGLDRGYEGKVSLLGQDLATLSDRALANLRNRHIGFVFQAFHLLNHLSCLDNVLLPNAFAQEPLGRHAGRGARDGRPASASAWVTAATVAPVRAVRWPEAAGGDCTGAAVSAGAAAV